MVLLLFPTTSVVPRNTKAPICPVVAKLFLYPPAFLMMAYSMVLLHAPFWNRILAALAPVFLLINIKSFVAPTPFSLPSMVTLSAPSNSIIGVARLEPTF